MIKIKIINGGEPQYNDASPLCLAVSDDMNRMDADAAERLEISPADLMEKASRAVFDYINKKLNTAYTSGITVLCGTGNNGGDGYALSRMFGETQRNVTVLNVFGNPPKSGAALLHFNRLNHLIDSNNSNNSNNSANSAKTSITNKAKNKNNIKIFNCPDLSDENLQEIFFESDIIIDAVFGTGFKGGLDGEARRVLKLANSAPDCVKLSVDVPTGTNCDGGSADINSFKADYTLTFEFVKQGLAAYPAAGYAGDIVVLPIGFVKETRDILLNKP